MNQSAEHDWVERARRGEPAALAELYRRYWRAARAAAYGVSGDFTRAEDAASEAFCAAIESLHALREADRFGPWLRTIVRRTARRLQAAERRKPAFTPREKEDEAPNIRLEQQELAASVREVVARLPPTLREAICLFYFEGYHTDEAARFLGIPTGTLKRRLHEGRQRLHATVEQILKGTKPMNPEQEETLQRLREAVDAGPDSEGFYQAVREALNLRPVPPDLLREILPRRRAAREPAQGPMTPEKKQFLRDALTRVYSPSERARDPNHPVGAAAQAIRAALPDFQPWDFDVYQIDFSRIAERMREDPERAFSFLSPPDFAREAPGAYLSATRALLIKDDDGSVLTMYELMRKNEKQAAFHAKARRGARMSDILWLLWKQAEPLELRAVEERLRHLAEAVAPGVSVDFAPYDEPRYRAGLRLQLGANPIPAALGGVLDPRPKSSDRVHAGSVMVYLEPWAAARSGQAIELANDVPIPLFGPSGPTPAKP